MSTIDTIRAAEWAATTLAHCEERLTRLKSERDKEKNPLIMYAINGRIDELRTIIDSVPLAPEKACDMCGGYSDSLFGGKVQHIGCCPALIPEALGCAVE